MLSWRVPTTGDPTLLRLALAQVALASIVAALIIFVALPRDWLALALLGLIPLAVFMAYRRWRAYHQAFTGAPNVRLDEHGLFWTDEGGKEHSFSRHQVTGFHIGRDADTLRSVPALTLYLAGGFESQPIELHPPATMDAVHGLLADDWHLAQRQPFNDPNSPGYDAAVSIYSECHDDYQEWHLEGPRAEFLRLFDILRLASQELPEPPPGAKPLFRTIRCTRREPQTLKIAVANSAHLDHDILALPADVLFELATRAAAAIRDGTAADLKLDVHTGPSSTWTFHLHVRMD